METGDSPIGCNDCKAVVDGFTCTTFTSEGVTYSMCTSTECGTGVPDPSKKQCDEGPQSNHPDAPPQGNYQLVL